MGAINGVIEFLMTITIIAVPIGLIAGIVLALDLRSQIDPSKKQKTKWWMKLSLFGPILMLVALIIVYGVIRLLFSTFK